jgi:hypothetical protein
LGWYVFAQVQNYKGHIYIYIGGKKNDFTNVANNKAGLSLLFGKNKWEKKNDFFFFSYGTLKFHLLKITKNWKYMPCPKISLSPYLRIMAEGSGVEFCMDSFATL